MNGEERSEPVLPNIVFILADDLGEWENVKNARNVRNADSIAHPNLPWY